MKKLTIFLLLFLPSIVTSCGLDEEEKESDGFFYYSFSTADEESLPDCEEAIVGWLAYLRDIEEFRVCTINGWEYVEIEGDRGIPGSRGDPGAKGDPGENGEDGEDGYDGLDGEDGEDLTEKGVGTSYIDPDSSITWTLAHESLSFADAVLACDDLGESLPATSFSYKMNYFFAVYFASLADGSSYWTSTPAGVGEHETRTVSSNGVTTADNDDVEKKLVFCVR